MSHLHSFFIGLLLVANPVVGMDETTHPVDADAIATAINQTLDNAGAPGRINADSALEKLLNNDRLDTQSRQKIRNAIGAYPLPISRPATQKLLFDLVIFGKKPLDSTGTIQQAVANAAAQNFDFGIYRTSNIPVYLSTIVDAQLQKESLMGGKKNEENSMQLYSMKRKLEEDENLLEPLDLSQPDGVIQENTQKQLLDLAYDCVLYTDKQVNSELLRDFNQALNAEREKSRLQANVQGRLGQKVASIKDLTEKRLKRIIEQEMLSATERGSALILYKMSQLLDEKSDQKVNFEEVFHRMPPLTINEYISTVAPPGYIEKMQSLKRAQTSAKKAKEVTPREAPRAKAPPPLKYDSPRINASPNPNAKPKITTPDSLDFSSASASNASSPNNTVSPTIPVGNLLGNGTDDSPQAITSYSPEKPANKSALPLIGFGGTAVAFASAILYLQRQERKINTLLKSIIDTKGQSLYERVINTNAQRGGSMQQENMATIVRDFNLSQEKMSEALRLFKKHRNNRVLRNHMIIPFAIGLLGSLATGHAFFKQD